MKKVIIGGFLAFVFCIFSSVSASAADTTIYSCFVHITAPDYSPTIKFLTESQELTLAGAKKRSAKQKEINEKMGRSVRFLGCNKQEVSK